MLQQKLADLDFEAGASACEADLGGLQAALGALLRSTATLSLAEATSRRALQAETQRLAMDDLEAAERSLETLSQIRELLTIAVDEERMGRVLGAAIVQTADALPHIAEIEQD